MKGLVTAGFVGTLGLCVAVGGCGGSDGGEEPLDSGVSDGVGEGGVNHPPIAVDDAAETREGEEVDIWAVVNDSDPDGDSLIVVEIAQPENGLVEILSGNERVRYTSVGDFVGIDQFTYTVSDQRGGTDEGTVTVNVEEVPILTLVITSPTEGATVIGTSVEVSFEAGGCNFTSPGQDSDGCHLHKFLDGVGYDGGTGGIGHYVPTPFTISGLSAGPHVISVELIANDGTDQPVSPYVSDTVNITVTP